MRSSGIITQHHPRIPRPARPGSFHPPPGRSHQPQTRLERREVMMGDFAGQAQEFRGDDVVLNRFDGAQVAGVPALGGTQADHDRAEGNQDHRAGNHALGQLRRDSVVENTITEVPQLEERDQLGHRSAGPRRLGPRRIHPRPVRGAPAPHRPACRLRHAPGLRYVRASASHLHLQRPGRGFSGNSRSLPPMASSSTPRRWRDPRPCRCSPR